MLRLYESVQWAVLDSSRRISRLMNSLCLYPSPMEDMLMQSTHFDDQGRLAREKAAALIVEAVDFVLKSSSCPVFLLGDLNSPVEEAAYRTIAARMHDLR